MSLLKKGNQELRAETSNEFRDLCSTYIQSRTKKSGANGNTDGALWPLVRQIDIKCSSPALSSGTTLVDLPGLADTNAARSAVALEYLEKCDHICIVAPISRAVDDKIAKGNQTHNMLEGCFLLILDSFYAIHRFTRKSEKHSNDESVHFKLLFLSFLLTTCSQLVGNQICNSFYSDLYAGL